jgi:hypothetical protein
MTTCDSFEVIMCRNLWGRKTSSLLTNSTSFEHTSETHPGGRGVLDSKRYGAIAGAGVFNVIVFLRTLLQQQKSGSKKRIAVKFLEVAPP